MSNQPSKQQPGSNDIGYIDPMLVKAKSLGHRDVVEWSLAEAGYQRSKDGFKPVPKEGHEADE